MSAKGEQVDVLAVGAHPDDIELTVGGTLLLAKSQDCEPERSTSPTVRWGRGGHPRPGGWKRGRRRRYSDSTCWSSSACQTAESR